MSRTQPDRRAGFGRRLFAPTLVACLAGNVPAQAADGLLDTMLEKMNLKAAPAAPGPDFIERTRPDPADLGYIPPALPHKVSPRPVKTAAQIEAEKVALDAARSRQLAPRAPVPLQLTTGKGAKPAPKPGTGR